jgi:hypothetical protein
MKNLKNQLDSVRNSNALEGVYVCMTVFHVYIALLNVLTKKKSALLLLTDNIHNVENLVKVINTQSSVLLYAVQIDNLKSKQIVISSNINKLFYYKILNSFYQKFLKKYDDLLKNTTINIFNDTEYFSRFLLKKYNKFDLLEDGLWAHPLIKKDIMYYIRHYVMMVPRKFGTSRKISQIILQDVSRLPVDIQHKGVSYSLEFLHDTLNFESKELLKNVFLNKFNSQSLLSSNKKLIILTQPLSEEGYVTETQKINIYINLINDYNKNNEFDIFIKRHPRDLSNYQKYYKNCTILSGDIPFEIFSLLNGISFDVGVTLWSGSIYNVSYIKKKIFLGESYIKEISKRV